MKPIYQPKGKAREYADWALNLYKGCDHGCTYCFAPSVLRTDRADFHKMPHPRKDILKHLEKQLSTGEFRGKRILLSFTSDPYQKYNDGPNLTGKAIRLIKRHGANFEVLTKGGSRAMADFAQYGYGDKFGTTMVFWDEKKSLEFEPMASSPVDRLGTMAAAKSWGIETWLSLEPVIDPEEAFRVIERTQHVVDHYKIGKLNYSKLNVDWRDFVYRAISMLEGMGKSYYIKESLGKYKEAPNE